jgi:ectoine hydroxylase-related dioxygenase (phytanoyl-CoA dioxygenase family)
MASWTRAELPKATKDLDRARADIDTYGYCLLEGAIPEPLLSRTRERFEEQAVAEKQREMAFEDGGPTQQWGAFKDEDGRIRTEAFKAANGGVNQRMWMLVNKGRTFLDVLELDQPHALIGHVLGEEFLLSSYSGNIAKTGGVAMNLHTDQWWAPEPVHLSRARSGLPVGSMNRTTFDESIAEPRDYLAPAAAANILYMLNDFTEANGGTRIAPMSHLYGRHPNVERDADVETVAAEGPAGTAIITDGRVWHGTGANSTNAPRLAMIATYCGPQYRAQENFTVGTDPEVLKTASPRLKTLLGLKVWWAYGRIGDPTIEFIDTDQPIQGALRPN